MSKWRMLSCQEFGSKVLARYKSVHHSFQLTMFILFPFFTGEECIFISLLKFHFIQTTTGKKVLCNVLFYMTTTQNRKKNEKNAYYICKTKQNTCKIKKIKKKYILLSLPFHLPISPFFHPSFSPTSVVAS